MVDGCAVTDGPPQAPTMMDSAATAANERRKDIGMEYRIGSATSAAAS